MDDSLAGLYLLAGGVIGSFLVYLATRKRDKPTLELAREQAHESGALAVGEAWAEYAATMERQLEKVRAEQEQTRAELVEARTLLAKALGGWTASRDRIAELEAELAALRKLMNEGAA